LAVAFLILTTTLILAIQTTGIENANSDDNVTSDPAASQEIGEIEYTDETGTHLVDFFNDSTDCFDWIKTNTPKDAVFLCWFDYGYSILGYAERNVIIKNPSQESLETITYLTGRPVYEFDSHDKILDVSRALITNNSDETIELMQKYAATYVFVHKNDPQKMVWPAALLELDYGAYAICKEPNGTFVPSPALSQTVLYQLSQDGATGFTLVYQGEAGKVYRIN
jgi:asparagine N-glycosylation enzyme membrane subunit Stt3